MDLLKSFGRKSSRALNDSDSDSRGGSGGGDGGNGTGATGGGSPAKAAAAAGAAKPSPRRQASLRGSVARSPPKAGSPAKADVSGANGGGGGGGGGGATGTPPRGPSRSPPAGVSPASGDGEGEDEDDDEREEEKDVPEIEEITFFPVEITLQELEVNHKAANVVDPLMLKDPKIIFSCQGTTERSSTPDGEPATGPDGKPPYVFGYREQKNFKRLVYSEVKGIELKISLQDAESEVAIATGVLVIRECTGQQMASVQLDAAAESPWLYTVRFDWSLGPKGKEDQTKKVLYPPNIIYVTVCHAKDLKPNDKGGTSDPYVKLRTGRWEATTSRKDKTLEPLWNEKFVIKLDHKDPKQELKITVMDHNTLIDAFLGEVTIGLSSYKTLEALDYIYTEERLLDRQGKSTAEGRWADDDTGGGGGGTGAGAPGTGVGGATGSSPLTQYLGKIKLRMVPSYAGRDVDMNKYTQGQIDYEGGRTNAEDSDEEDEGMAGMDPEEIKKEQERIKLEREMYEKEMKRLEAIEVKEGNYTILVHVIEVRDLKSEDLNGSNDPCVHVECFGQSSHTKIKNKCNSAVFDDLFYFELKDMTRDDLEAGAIKVSVMDADVVSKDLIGAFQTDFEFVYYRENHELYRAWVALVDNSNVADSGAQGYLMLSITVLGPGDKPPAHDRKKEIEMEQKAMAASGDSGGLPSASALMPQVTQSLHFLEVTLYMADDLPPMDRNIAGGTSIDAYVKINFGDGEPVLSKVRTVKGRSNAGGLLSVTFEERIMIPIQVPTMTNRIEITVWDKDMIKDEAVGTCAVFDFRAVQKGFHEKPFWVPLYGAVFPDSNPLFDHDEIDRQNSKSRESTTYRGKLLLSLREDLNDGKKKRPQKVIKRALRARELPPAMPATAGMVLRAQIYSGNDLPDTDGPFKSKLSVVVCLGPYYAMTERRELDARRAPGVLHWNAVVQIPEVAGEVVKLPLDIRQLPDIFVYLKKGKGDGAELVSFHRVGAEEIFKTNFEQEPFWLKMSRDKATRVCKPDQYPGALLLRLGLGTADMALQTQPHWAPIERLTLHPVRLNVYIYMGRDLCPGDDTGLLDPYVKVRFNGEVKQTAKVIQTRNPNFFASLFFDTMLPDEDHLWPEIAIEVWDWDPGLDPDDFVGGVRVPAQKVFRTSVASFMTKRLPKPKWYPMQFFQPQDSQGEMLLNFEVITKAAVDEHVPSPRDIAPATEDAFIEVIPIGLRDLQQKGPIPIVKPFVEIRVGNETTVHCTEASRLPNTVDPNFRPEAIRIPCKIPSDPMFAPCLNVSVFDKRLGGLSKPLLGTTSIPLGSRMKGGPDYRPPGGVPYAINPFMDEPPKQKAASAASAAVPTPMSGGVSRTAQTPVWGGRGDGVEESKGGEGPQKRPSIFSDVADSGGTFFRTSAGMLSEASASLVAGAAVFAALPGADGDVAVVREDDTTEPYMVGRERMVDELEWHMQSTPFEEFALFRGMKRPAGATAGLFDEPHMKVGYFKGVVRVVRASHESGAGVENADPLPFDLRDLLSPVALQVRVYILQGSRLRSLDTDNKSDPYLKLRLGRTEVSDRENAISGVVNDVDFYKYFEMNAKFPGAGKLEVSCYDKDQLAPDELIGTTVVDLEDRWFSKQWRQMGWDLTSPTDPKMVTPVETRSLWSPKSTNPQGSISMWIDIVPSRDVPKYKPVNITPPPQQKFELRLVVWKVRNWDCPGDFFSGMTDLYFKAAIAMGEPQETDTHLRMTTTASFNWRMKFPVSLPAKGEGATYLSLQAWDLDILMNEMLVETTFDLSKFFNKAYKANEPMHYFPLQPPKTGKMAQVAAKLKENKKSGGPLGSIKRLFAPKPAASTAGAAMPSGAETTGSINRDGGGSCRGVGEIQLAGPDVESGLPRLAETTSLLRDASTTSAGSYGGVGGSGHSGLGGSGHSGGSGGRRSHGGRTSHDTAGSSKGGSRRSTGEHGAAGKRKKKITMWDRLKDTMGFGPIPDYSDWVTLKKTVIDKKGKQVTQTCGEVCISMELLPESYAKKRQAGMGRSEPNANPPMPEPEGRPDPMKMFNPIYLLKTCMGEGLLMKFCGTFLCLGLFVGFIFVGPSLYDLFLICMSLPGGGWLLAFCFLLMCGGCLYTADSCRRNCAGGDNDDDDEEDKEAGKK